MFQAEQHFELQLSASFDIKAWNWISTITAIESKNQVMFCGQRNESDHWSLCTFQNNLDRELEETRMDITCQHGRPVFYRLTPVVQNGKELLAVSCDVCSNIKLVDMETKEVTPVFKSPADPMWGICFGPDNCLIVGLRNGNILQLDNSFNIINTFNVGEWSHIGIKNIRGVDHFFYPTHTHMLPSCPTQLHDCQQSD